MRIALDVRSIHGQKTGKEWYTFSLLENLVKLGAENTYYLYSRYDFDLNGYPKNCVKKVINVHMMFWHMAVVWDMIRSGVHLYFGTASYIIASLLIFSRIKVLLTVHDVVAFLHPDKHQKKALIIEKLTASLAFWKSAKIICPSLNTKKDLECLFPKSRGKTVFIAEAARENFHEYTEHDEKRSAILSKYQLPEQFILNIGTLSPRKNLTRLLKAYAKLPDEIRSVYPLLFIGGKGWYYHDIFETVQQLSLEHHVQFLGYVDDFDLPYILEKATCFVYPSLYEGFGLPLLEAMACGVPVIASDNAAHLEVAKGASEIVCREDIEDMKRGMLKVLTDEKYRTELREKGLKRVKEYSWEKVGRETLEIIRGI